MQFEPWWMFIPFVAIIAPPVGAILAAVAIFRATGGFDGHRERVLLRKEARQKWVEPAWMKVHREANR